MFCQASFDQRLGTIMHHLAHVSKPQATVLALWSFGMVLARSCALTAVSHLLAKGMQLNLPLKDTCLPHGRLHSIYTV